MTEFEYPCLLNVDVVCPESCPSRQKIVEAFKEYVKIKNISIEEALKSMRKADSLIKTLFSAQMQDEKGFTKDNCEKFDEARAIPGL
jgi:hypothetical protein